MTCGRHLVNDPQPTYQIWTQSAKWFLRYRSAVCGYLCTCARAEMPHLWLLHKLQLIGPQEHTKFQHNRPSRYRATAGGKCVTPSGRHASRATVGKYWHDSTLVPYTVEGMGGTHQRRPLVNRAFGSRDISLSKAWPRPTGRPAGRPLILRIFPYSQ